MTKTYTVEELRKKAKAKHIPLSKNGKQKTKKQLAKALGITLPKRKTAYKRRNPIACDFAGYNNSGLIPAEQSWTYQPYMYGGGWANEKAKYMNNTPDASLGDYPLESYPLFSSPKLSGALGYTNSAGVLANRNGGYFANMGVWDNSTPSESKGEEGVVSKIARTVSNAASNGVKALTGSGGSPASVVSATPSGSFPTPSASFVQSRRV